MTKIVPCLWFADDAETAVDVYVSLIPGSRKDRVQKNVIDAPGGKAGSVLLVEFTLAGEAYLALNGGQRIEPNQAVSFCVECEDQAEIDRLWDGFIGHGGAPVQCGWLCDRWGYSWQIVPARLRHLVADPDRAKAARVMEALLGMVKIDLAALDAAHRGA